MCCKRDEGPRGRGPGTRTRCWRRRRGFTLVEIMVVIVIVALLAAASTVSVRSYLIRSKRSVAAMDIAKIGQALDTYYTAFDKFPSTDEGLAALVAKSDEFPEGLLKKLPQDPWKHAYVYRQPGEDGPFDVICLGADNQEGGEGADRDVTSAEVEQ